MENDLRLMKLREYNRAYYQKNKKRIIASRKATDKLKIAIWQMNYWTRKVEQLQKERL